MIPSIPKPRITLTPTPFDIKSCNYYIEGASIIIESIPEYLLRNISTIRSPGVIVTMLIPNDDYTSLGIYPINQFGTIVSNFTEKFYSFVGGIADINFVEILVVNTANSVQGKGTIIDPVTLVNDIDIAGANKYYGTNELSVKGYHSLSILPTLPDVEPTPDSDLLYLRDQCFEFQDIVGIEYYNYTLDIESIHDYTIVALILFSDGDIGDINLVNESSGKSIFSDNVPITAETKYKYILGTNPDNTEFPECIVGDFITLNIYSLTSLATFVRGKLIYRLHKKIPNMHSSYSSWKINITEPNTTVGFYVETALPVDIDFGDGQTLINGNPRLYDFTHIYENIGIYTVTIFNEYCQINTSDIIIEVLELVNQVNLDISYQPITSINLTGCDTLRGINIYNTALSNIIGLIDCIDLRYIAIYNNNLSVEMLETICITLTNPLFDRLHTIDMTDNLGTPSTSIIETLQLAHPDLIINI